MLSEIAQNIGVPAETLEEHEEREYDHDSQDECGLDGQYKFDPVERARASMITSTQAMAKVLCALNNVIPLILSRVTVLTYNTVSRLQILQRVRAKVNKLLGRDCPDWRFVVSYIMLRLPDDPPLVPAQIHGMDGNNSAKRCDGASSADEHIFQSPYLISNEDVDVFQNETMLFGHQDEEPPDICTDNWTVANTVDDHTIKIFEQTGIFILACRHGIVETLVEMRHSGELAKYALATVNKLLSVFGSNQVIGYDIGFSFAKTISRSSLSNQAELKNLMMAVNSFYGHAHNCTCQLTKHPLYLKGFAHVIQHASHFHWLQYLDLHFNQWDQDKYQELSNFLSNNYKQVLAILQEYGPELDKFRDTRGFTGADYEQWRTEELEYLTRLTQESDYEVRVPVYIGALEKVTQLE
ncbi:hypothetical protein SERLADRAFT_440064 [Serpula lacrymans var. lacrymans S7.9]|uniref:CxC1-like cysteine cluster associated with KDZ transposases domain-containing protein n=1 Tax=Serpula lacrymans var. lacrymans (strain S7.9) TaxID=578457 RepID=F8P2F5_SERL9|nr:uncharacterized protein SERLADRAFT_440064 [Serpula lacrymans var. lacrymans S7.9]EGO23333.1 hypothetical protein SERLADRAFT_440064 [Serpula lacrymans var. lacrymans S7.9]